MVLLAIARSEVYVLGAVYKGEAGFASDYMRFSYVRMYSTVPRYENNFHIRP